MIKHATCTRKYSNLAKLLYWISWISYTRVQSLCHCTLDIGPSKLMPPRSSISHLCSLQTQTKNSLRNEVPRHQLISHFVFVLLNPSLTSEAPVLIYIDMCGRIYRSGNSHFQLDPPPVLWLHRYRLQGVISINSRLICRKLILGDHPIV